MPAGQEDGSPGLDEEAVVGVVSSEPVTLAVLYGSHARNEAGAGSDLDLAVEFEDSLSSAERTRARLRLIERIGTELRTNRVDIVPLSGASDELRAEILADGIVLYGSTASLEAYDPGRVDEPSIEDRLADFDELLAELERVV